MDVLMPVLIWLHSKKHDEKNPLGQWHCAWSAMADVLYPGAPSRLIALEHEVHEAIGIPTNSCACEACTPAHVD